ncbi:MAG: DUF664 domain-containing protein [Candidatus Tectimicrobiota bacterium]
MSIAPEDVLPFINRALDGMVSIVETLGDALVNQRPNLPGANSPYIILAHCVGLTQHILGRVLGGRPGERDREAEFCAQGTVAEIRQAVRTLQEHIKEDIQHVQGDAPPVYPWQPRQSYMLGWRQGAILLQCYTELAQHHGHMELTRDILLAQARVQEAATT